MDKIKRILYYIFGCVMVRAIMIVIVKNNLKYLKLFGIISLIIGIAFIHAFLYSKKTHGFFGGPVWWNNNRLIHGLLYILFSIMALSNNHNSWIVLLVSLIFGITSFTLNYIK